MFGRAPRLAGRRLRSAALLILVLWSSSLAGQGTAGSYRVFARADARAIDLSALVADVAGADVLVLGEQAEDPSTHRLELVLLRAIGERRGEVILALDALERPAQEPLDHFLMGHLSASEFLAESGARPGFAAAYQPLLNEALARTWPVRAAGTAGLATEEISDERIAETIATAHAVGSAGGKWPLVVSINRAGGNDVGGGQGVIERIRRRLPRARIVTVTVRPVASLDDVSPGVDAGRLADYRVFTRADGAGRLTTPRDAGPSAGSSSSAP